MKILVMSDSHGRPDRVDQAVDQAVRQVGRVDHVIHCGDAEVLSPALAWAVVVRGNQDRLNLKDQEILSLLSLGRCLVVHGHQQGVKKSLRNLVQLAQEEKAEVACFGHTHQPFLGTARRRLFLNPGSLLRPRQVPFPTYVVLDWQPDRWDCTFFRLGMPSHQHVFRIPFKDLVWKFTRYLDYRHSFFLNSL